MLSPDAESSRNNILDAAEECFAEGGYAGTSLRRIASKAGITQPLILHYFKSKQHLFDSVLERAVVDYEAVQHHQWQRRAGDPDFITVGLSILFGWLKGKRRLLRLGQWARLEGRLPLTAQGNDIWSRVVHQLQAGVDQGLLRADLDVEATLILIDALTKGYWDRRNLYIKVRPVLDDGGGLFDRRMQRTFLTTVVYAIFTPAHQPKALASIERVLDDVSDASSSATNER